MNTTELELFFLDLMDDKGIKNEAELRDFYEWVTDTLCYAYDEFIADAGWEEGDEE